MCAEFLKVYDKCPAKVKKLLKSPANVNGRMISQSLNMNHKLSCEYFFNLFYILI